MDCTPALHPGAIQGKEGIKCCHLATLPKVIAYSIYRPWTEDPKERQLVALDFNERVTILEGNPMRKDSEFLELFSHYLVKMQGGNSAELNSA